MIRTILNWLKLDAQNLIAEVWWAMLILWVALVLVAVFDVSTNTITGTTKFVWVSAIVLLPLVGLFAYCAFCLTRADYHMLEFLFRRRRSTRRRESSASAPTR